MFPILLNVFILLAVPILVLNNKHKLLFMIAFWSIVTDFVFVNIIGYKFFAATYISFWYFVIYFKNYFSASNSISKYLLFEIISVSIIGIFYVVFSPWADPYESFRKETQKLPLRTIVGIIRTGELVLVFQYFFFVFATNKIKLNEFLNILITSLIIFLLIGAIDTFILSGRIRIILMPGHYSLERFTGLQGEPRGIGQLGVICIFILLPLLKYFKDSNTKILLGISCSLLFIAFSFSSTAAAYGALCYLIYILWGKAKVKQIIFSFIILSGMALVLLSSEEFVQHQVQRIAMVALEGDVETIDNVPEIINSLEIFDQSAAAFLWLNPIHSVFGIGPNTINIPASVYSNVRQGYNFDSLDTAPSNGVIYVISRVGLFGFLIFLIIFYKSFKYIKKSENPYLIEIFTINFIYNLLYRNMIFWLVAGIIVGLVYFELEKRKKQTIYTKLPVS